MTTTTYLVEGMTCAHCVSSVTEEVSSVAGVTSVAVDLHVGGVSRVDVVSDAPVTSDDIRAAIAEAGYAVAQA
ncbi:cation transporter [Salinibacterium sp.]|uniref:heavy-metal-associated domain-containing protein n=1 Tax=Salinibacterium sp. TaxID=1915057 RepID=UPI00286C27E6|nr:cation transporter [Salinibacterium sp.]